MDLPGRSVGQWPHPLASGCLGEADGVAGGDDDVGVVEQPVDGGVGDRLGHQQTRWASSVVRREQSSPGRRSRWWLSQLPSRCRSVSSPAATHGAPTRRGSAWFPNQSLLGRRSQYCCWASSPRIYSPQCFPAGPQHACGPSKPCGANSSAGHPPAEHGRGPSRRSEYATSA